MLSFPPSRKACVSENELPTEFMKKRPRAFRALPTFSTFAVLLGLSSPAGQAGDYTYTTNNGTIAITKYTGSGGDVIIPEAVGGLPVTSIGISAFYFCSNLTSVTLPDSVTTIGDLAFRSCTRLTNVTIPNSITAIGNLAFGDCSRLTSVTIPDSLTTIGDRLLYHCTSLTTLTIGNSVATIGDEAFSWCGGLTNLTVPKSVTTIGNFVFYDCSSLSSVFFEGNAPGLGSYVFEGDDTATVYYLPGTTGWGPSFGGRPAALWNPQIQTSHPTFGVGPNGFGFTITGTTNIPIVVEATTALTGGTSVPLQSCTLTNGSLRFTDPDWIHYHCRFYRIRSP
jgi:hypothetical protein